MQIDHKAHSRRSRNDTINHYFLGSKAKASQLFSLAATAITGQKTGEQLSSSFDSCLVRTTFLLLTRPIQLERRGLNHKTFRKNEITSSNHNIVKIYPKGHVILKTQQACEAIFITFAFYSGFIIHHVDCELFEMSFFSVHSYISLPIIQNVYIVIFLLTQ